MALGRAETLIALKQSVNSVNKAPSLVYKALKGETLNARCVKTSLKHHFIWELKIILLESPGRDRALVLKSKKIL